MKKKLNASYDFAILKERALERDKIRYEETQLYKDISKIMIYDEKKLVQNLETAL